MPVKRVIIINGSGGVGKDTFIQMCENALKEPTDELSSLLSRTKTRIDNYSSVTAVKQIAETVGWNGDKTAKDRKFLAELKSLLTDYNNFPMNDMVSHVENENKECYFDKIVFLAIREPSEIEKAVTHFKQYNPVTLLVTNSNVPPVTTNHADKSVFDYEYDVQINNSLTKQDLRDKAVAFLTDLGKGTLKKKY